MILAAVLAFYVAQIQAGNVSPAIIRDYISTEALVVGIDPQMALAVARNESRFNPNAVGDHGESLGIWQIHMPAHTDISPENARNVVFSTEWALTTMKNNGGCQIWSTCPTHGG